MATEPFDFASRYPHIADWIEEEGEVEIGYDFNTDSCVRALDEGGMVWSGGKQAGSLDEWLQALDAGLADFMEEERIG